MRLLAASVTLTMLWILPAYAKKDKNLDLNDTGLDEPSDKIAVLFVPRSASTKREKVSWRHPRKAWKVVFTYTAPPCPEVSANAISGAAGQRTTCTAEPVGACPATPPPLVTYDNKRYCRYPYDVYINNVKVADPEIVIEEDPLR